MQLPSDEAVVMLSGLAPIRAKKLRYFTDANFQSRVMPAPRLQAGSYLDAPPPRADDWSCLLVPEVADGVVTDQAAFVAVEDGGPNAQHDQMEAAGLPEHQQVSDLLMLDEDDFPVPLSTQPVPRMQCMSRQASLDPEDGIAL